MSTDLDRMFTALRVDADAVPLPEPDAPRQRGERRRRTQLTTAAIATTCVLLTVVGGGTWLVRAERDPGPATPPRPNPVTGERVDFRPLRQVGTGLDTGALEGVATTATVGDTAYLGWQDHDGELRVAALDVTTGRPRWSPRAVGRYDGWAGLVVLPQALVLLGGDHGSSAVYNVFVIDPATGKLRWQQPFDSDGTDVDFFAAALVLAEGHGGVTRALDWRTGDELWSTPNGTDPPLLTLGAHTPEGVDTYGTPLGTGQVPVHRGDDVFQITRSGKLIVRDVRTGVVRRAPLPGAAPAAHSRDDQQALAYGGRLFVGTRAVRPHKVAVTELTGSGDTRVLYAVPADRRLEQMFLCGARLCLTEGRAGEPNGRELVAVDPASGKVAWRADVPESEILAPAGERVLFVAGPRGVGVLDAGGRPALTPEGGGAGGWVTAGSALELRQSPDGQMEVFGMAAPGWRRTSLGRVRALSFGCTWNQRYLTCPALDGFRTWQFA